MVGELHQYTNGFKFDRYWVSSFYPSHQQQLDHSCKKIIIKGLAVESNRQLKVFAASF